MSENGSWHRVLREYVASDITSLLKKSSLKEDILVCDISDRNDIPVWAVRKFLTDVKEGHDWVSDGYSLNGKKTPIDHIRSYLLSLFLLKLGVEKDDQLVDVIKWEFGEFEYPEQAETDYYSNPNARKETHSKSVVDYNLHQLLDDDNSKPDYFTATPKKKKDLELISAEFYTRFHPLGIKQKTLAKLVHEISDIPLWDLQTFISCVNTGGRHAFPQKSHVHSVAYRRLTAVFQTLGVLPNSTVIQHLKKGHHLFAYPIMEYGPIGFRNNERATEILERILPGLGGIDRDRLTNSTLNPAYAGNQES